MAYSTGQSSYKMAFEVAPITLVNGIASSVPGGAISILSLLQASTFGGLNGDGSLDLDRAFANFFPVAGGTLIEYEVAHYPFANMTVAANAMVAQPLTISLQMRIPVRETGGYASKPQVMAALQATLAQHQQAGGIYSVATPTFFYPNVLLRKLHDVSGGESLQAQTTYQWDFEKPLVTLEDAQGAQNAMMSLLSSGGATDGALSGVTPSLGQPLADGASPATSPAGIGSIGTGVGTGAFGVTGPVGSTGTSVSGGFGLSGGVGA